MDEYAVFGNPVKHSRSPFIHKHFASQFEQTLLYDAVEVEEAQFETAVSAFFKHGGKGLNITVPFKLKAFKMADCCSDRAIQAEAVNTLMLSEAGLLYGDNTDGVGLIRDLRDNLGLQLAGRKILLLGAGGAVRGVLAPLLAESPAALCIANRTSEKARKLVSCFASLAQKNACLLASSTYQELSGAKFDLIINGTSASVAGNLPPVPADVVDQDTACYDMMYGAEPTVFLRWAKNIGCHSLSDGLGMLVEQAAESFYLWRQLKPTTKTVIADIRQDMKMQANK